MTAGRLCIERADWHIIPLRAFIRRCHWTHHKKALALSIANKALAYFIISRFRQLLLSVRTARAQNYSLTNRRAAAD